MAVGVTFPRGFVAAGVTAGIKASGRPDVAIVAASQSVPAAAVFTRSATAAPPVIVSRAHIAEGTIRAIVISSGNANAATGTPGQRDAERMAALVAAGLGCKAEQVLVASTGVIGVPLPMHLVEPGIEQALAALSDAGGADAAVAITTTDAAPKLAERQVDTSLGSIRVGGIAKGAGMIRPDLGTMIAVLTTDAALDPSQTEDALRAAVERTFNCITVDGCTSTSDTVALLASGVCAGVLTSDDVILVNAAIQAVCEDLALQIVRDGEGAHRIAHWTVTGAKDAAEARTIAYAVAEAQLVRCALNGGDPNWGRIVAALGVTGCAVVAERIEITLGGHTLCREGMAVEHVDTAAVNVAAARETVEIGIDLGVGTGTASIWASDLSKLYVELNADYTT
ncbi:MAG: bifunctional glutamate N-acetyltransferase/amino-acid acetyltransferase ArgJ [Thermoleophilia bacterium]|nr:bifunctional glutamate N-acetyltransferase/amino-acid acetyltransferase ArgJ [Thermoleophilia bacterium]